MFLWFKNQETNIILAVKTQLEILKLIIYMFLFMLVNHHFHFNAEFHPFHFHPVLGFIMAVVAVKDIMKGSEVRDLIVTNFLMKNFFQGFRKLWIQECKWVSKKWYFSERNWMLFGKSCLLNSWWFSNWFLLQDRHDICKYLILFVSGDMWRCSEFDNKWS